jgi:hypothetical protein
MGLYEQNRLPQLTRRVYLHAKGLFGIRSQWNDHEMSFIGSSTLDY